MAEFIVPRTVTISELKEGLKTRFSFQEDKAQTIDRRYQDTFDWRLYNKRYIYFVDRAPDTTLITLSSVNTDGKINSLQVVSSPVFAEDVKSIVFRKKLVPLLGIRALVDKLSIVIRRYPLRYVDKDKKNRMHVFIDDYRLVQDNGKTRMLDKRIRFEAVKGYDKTVNMISEYITSKFKLPVAEQSIFETAASILNIQAGQYSSQLNARLDPALRTDQSLKNILFSSFDVMMANEEGIIRDIDTEFLHDFRVAVRRTRSVLGQIKDVYPKNILEKIVPAIKWLGEITGPTRDMHVYLLKFDSYRQALPLDRQQCLEPLHAFLMKHQKIEHQGLVKQFKTARYRIFKKKWHEFLVSPVIEKTTMPVARQPVRETADAHIWKAFKRVIKQGQAITTNCPDEKLHSLRISCKKLRYLLEFFQSLYPDKKLKLLIKPLKQLQDILGDFQDLSVQINSIKELEVNMQAEGVMTPDTFDTMQLLVTHFNDRIKSQRGLYMDSFVLFSRQNNQMLFKNLFKPVAKKGVQ